MPKSRSGRPKKRRFCGNRYTRSKSASISELTAISSKLNSLENSNPEVQENNIQDIKGKRIIDIENLVHMVSILCCPECLKSGLKLKEESNLGLSSNFTLVCPCGFTTEFNSISTKKEMNT